MRVIGQIRNAEEARIFSDYLYVQGIQNEVEADAQNNWVVWVHSEDELGRATDLLNRFQANPTDPEFRRGSVGADKIRADEQKEREAYQKKLKRGQLRRSSTGLLGMGRATAFLVVFSIGLYLAKSFSDSARLLENHYLYMGDPYHGTFEDILHGQLWRFVTPIFIHLSLLHIFFNMLMLKDFGSMVEGREGTWVFIFMVAFIAIGSNTAEYILVTGRFGGMSGVNYGLFGFIWMKSRYQPHAGYYIHPYSVAILMIWFVMGFSAQSGIANMVHAGGLIIGALCAFVIGRR